MEKLRIITPDVGGGFGAKYLIYPEEVVVPLAARLLRRPFGGSKIAASIS